MLSARLITLRTMLTEDEITRLRAQLSEELVARLDSGVITSRYCGGYDCYELVETKPGAGRPRIYCSDACRHKAYERATRRVSGSRKRTLRG